MMGRLPEGERRRFKRVSLKTDVFYKFLRLPAAAAGDPLSEGTVYLVNLSEIGLAVRSGSPWPCEALVEVTFNFLVDGRRNVKVTAQGQVRYCLLMGDYRSHQVGVEFTQIADADRRWILECVGSASEGHG